MAKVSVIKKKVKKDPRVTKIKEVEYKCLICGKKKKVNKNYFTNPLTPLGFTPYCKTCLYERAFDPDTQKLTKKGLVAMLQLIDRPYIEAFWINVKRKDTTEQAKLGLYLRSIGTPTTRNMKFANSDKEVNEPDYETDSKELVYSDKWSGWYTDRQVEILNKKFEAYKNDFNLATEVDKDNAMKIAKASLALDIAQDDYNQNKCTDSKLKNCKDVYDSLCKSSNFSKASRNDAATLTCFGRIFDEVEKNIWIPQYKPEEPDVYDTLISQLSVINKSL